MAFRDPNGISIRGEGRENKAGFNPKLHPGILAAALGPAGACGLNPTTAKANLLGAGATSYTLEVTGLPTSGSLIFKCGTQQITIQHSDTASTVQTNLRALTNLDNTLTAVASASGPLPQQPLAMRIVFLDSVALTDRTVSLGTISLSGGTSPTATLTSDWGYTGTDVDVLNYGQSIDAAAGTFGWFYKYRTHEYLPAILDC